MCDAAEVGIWMFRATSINEVAQANNMRRARRPRCVYNDIDKYGTIVLMGKRLNKRTRA